MPLAKDNSGPALVDGPHGAGINFHPTGWHGPTAPPSRPWLGFSRVSSAAIPPGVRGADLGSNPQFADGSEDKPGFMGFLKAGFPPCGRGVPVVMGIASFCVGLSVFWLCSLCVSDVLRSVVESVFSRCGLALRSLNMVYFKEQKLLIFV